jgi:hypothetical protein
MNKRSFVTKIAGFRWQRPAGRRTNSQSDLPQKDRWQHMKHIAIVALMFNLGVAGVHAQQKPVMMTFSGTSTPSTVNLQYPSTNNSEDNTAGNGSLGPFTFRNVRAINAVPEPSSTCSGPTKVFFSSVAGAGVFSFQDKDGSQLKVKLIQAGDCIDFQALEAHCTMTFQITGGNGRFKNATGGILTLTELNLPVAFDKFGTPVFFAPTGTITGTVLGVAEGE